MSISISSSSVGASSYVSAVSASKVASAAASATGEDSSDSSSVSGPAAMLNKLKALQKSDPAKFKEAMSAISKKLTDEADASTDSKQKAALTDMASRFQSAGESGDLSAITPPAKPTRSVGGAARSGGPPSSSSTSTEAADTNQDGTVSETERAAYEAKQAETKGVDSSSSAADSKRAAHAYAKLQGGGPGDAMKSTMSAISSIVDPYAA